ncbi:T9SS type A sorting domain-containing protein [Flavicella sediminum]|uniref:T9SS type A sorting domain-containing protein n=1 Tax=Flavicella sediminum TaxID=2585141 RepID=UPI0011248C1E|nr:T9SS type A sorting domain-containing protein [Flavicella sediminum]
MKQKITFLLILYSVFFYGQTMVNDFESGASGILNLGGGITSSVVVNPSATGVNTTFNCLEIKRTAAQWWIFQGIDVNDLAISGTEKKYLSFMFYCSAQTDLGIRFDAPNDESNGTATVRPINSYTDFNQWQEIVFEIKDAPSATAFTLGTLYRISIHPDIGVENDPAGQILNNTGTFAYIDQIKVLDENPLSIASYELEKSISYYPNPVKASFKIEAKNEMNIKNIAVYSILGEKIMDNLTRIRNSEYDTSTLVSGLYIIKIQDEKGIITSMRLIKD